MRFMRIACLALVFITPAVQAQTRGIPADILHLIFFDRTASMKADLDGEGRIDDALYILYKHGKTYSLIACAQNAHMAAMTLASTAIVARCDIDFSKAEKACCGKFDRNTEGNISRLKDFLI